MQINKYELITYIRTKEKTLLTEFNNNRSIFTWSIVQYLI